MTFDWHTEFARALALFGGDTPSATLEQDLLDAFKDHPQAVTNAITKIGKGYQAGKIHSPWGALKAEIPKQISADIHVGDGNERARAIANAEQWLRNAGLMFPTWTEVELEVYNGYLEPWNNDRQLKERIEAIYNDLRPTGIRVEHEEIARSEAWKKTRPHMDAVKRLENQAA